MSAFGCADAQELAADLALGTLGGEQRALLLEHLSRCPSCEQLVAAMSGVVDDLLVLTPEVEPPPGFESAVLARIARSSSSGNAPGASPPAVTGPPPQRLAPVSSTSGDGSSGAGGRTAGWLRKTAPRLLAAAAAVVVLAGVVGGTITFERRHQPSPLARQYAGVLGTLGGKELRGAPLVGRGNLQWGQAFVYEGTTSWVFVTMRWDVPDGTYSVVLDRRGAPSMRLSEIRLASGEGSLGQTIGDTRDIVAVRVVDAAGRTMCTARMS